jgi:hypothetical protein
MNSGYITRQELERRKKMEEEKHKKLAEEEKKRELHYMCCPKCGMPLGEVEYKGINIGKCFQCDGVWLDAGEIEAIIEARKNGAHQDVQRHQIMKA